MGLRFRRSIKIAPGVKLNLNKKSVGVTVGTRGAHYTINSKGKKTASVGIPGTGLSYTSTSTSGGSFSKSSSHTGSNTQKTAPNNQNDSDGQKWYQKTSWIIALLFLFFPVGLFLMWKHTNWNKYVKIGISAFIAIALFMPSSTELEKITLRAETSQNYDINEEVLIEYSTESDDYTLAESDFCLSGGELQTSDDNFVFFASEPGTYNIYAENSGVKSNELIITVEDKAAIAQTLAEEQAKKEAEEKARQEAEEAKKQAEEEAKKQAEQEVQQQESAQQSSASTTQQPVKTTPSTEVEETTVYITNTGEKYHRGTCRHLKDSKIEKKLSEVINNYVPCGTCKPPTQ